MKPCSLYFVSYFFPLHANSSPFTLPQPQPEVDGTRNTVFDYRSLSTDVNLRACFEGILTF